MAPWLHLLAPIVLLGCLSRATAQVTAGAADAAGLLALKSAVTNAAFPSWTGTAPCGAAPWANVTCSGGRVVALDLGGLGLQGSLPDELGGMDQLQLASLGGNAFTGVLPAAWGMNGAFPLLVSLDVNGSSLAGDLPATWGAAAAFPALQSLVLDGNAIAGSLPQTWGGAGAFPVMTTLSVRNNALEGALPPTWCNAATSLPTIQTLQLDSNQLSGSLPDFWGGIGCQQMRTMDLHNNSLSGALPTNWASTGYWPALALLRLDGNSLSGEFPAQWTAPTAFPAMRAVGTGIMVQPGNQLTGGVPTDTKFPVLAISADGATSAVTTLADTAPAPAPADAPAAAPEPAADATAAKPATVTAIVRLAGSSLWPFTSLQAAAFKSVVLAGLSSGSDGVTVTQSQLTIGAAKRSTGSVSQFSNVQQPGRRLLQSTSSIEVPVYVLTTIGEAEAVKAALAALVRSSSFRTQLDSAGFSLNSVALASISSSEGDTVPPPAAPVAATAPASSSGKSDASVGAIVGGVLGGLAGLALIALALWAWRRHRQNKQAQYITQRIVKPVRQPSISGAGMPYRKSTLATVQETYGGEWCPAMDAVSTHSDSPSSRSGRITQGLYMQNSSGISQEVNLLDHARSGSGNGFPYPEISSGSSSPLPLPPVAGGGGTLLTQSALGAHTSMTNPEGAAGSWTSRFARTFAAAQ